MRLNLGTKIFCLDGFYGELVDVIVACHDHLTHMVVAPNERHELARMIALDRVYDWSHSPYELEIDYTKSELANLEPVEHSVELDDGGPVADDSAWDIGIEEILSAPYDAAQSVGVGLGLASIMSGVPLTEVYDRIPHNAAEIRKASSVTSSDTRYVGRVKGFVVDYPDTISHLILHTRRLWIQREVLVPIRKIASIRTDQIRLTLTKSQLRTLGSGPAL